MTEKKHGIRRGSYKTKSTPESELKRLRTRKGLTQGEVGKHFGKGASHIHNLEEGFLSITKSAENKELIKEITAWLKTLPDKEKRTY